MREVLPHIRADELCEGIRAAGFLAAIVVEGAQRGVAVSSRPAGPGSQHGNATSAAKTVTGEHLPQPQHGGLDAYYRRCWPHGTAIEARRSGYARSLTSCINAEGAVIKMHGATVDGRPVLLCDLLTAATVEGLRRSPPSPGHHPAVSVARP